MCRLHLKCDGSRAETRFRLSAKRTSPFKSAGASVQLTTGSRGVDISGSNAGCTTFQGSVKSTGYPLHSPVARSLSLPCVTVCHHIFFLPFNFQPSWFVQTLLMVYSIAMLKSNGNKASPCFRLSLKKTCHTNVCPSGLYSQFHLNTLILGLLIS